MSSRSVTMAMMIVAVASAAGYGIVIPCGADATVVRTTLDYPDNGADLNTAFNGTSGKVLRTSHLQFTLGTEAVTSATFYLFGTTLPGNTYPGANVNGDVYAKVGSFDEATLTWRIQWGGDVNPDWTGWTRLGDLHDLADDAPLVVNDYNFMDITAFYNANLGQTIHIALRASTPTNSALTKFASKENATPNSAPYLDIVPEPASLALLALGAALLVPRKRD